MTAARCLRANTRRGRCRAASATNCAVRRNASMQGDRRDLPRPRIAEREPTLNPRADQMLSMIERQYNLTPGEVLEARKMLMPGDDDVGDFSGGIRPPPMDEAMNGQEASSNAVM